MNKTRGFILSTGFIRASIFALVGTLYGLMAVAEPQSPVEPVKDRDVYHPGTEALGKDEMRVTA